MSGRILPISKAREKGLNKSKTELVRFSTISLILVFIALFIEVYLTSKYLGKDLYANYSLFLVVLGGMGLLGSYHLNPKLFDFSRLNDQYLRNSTKSLQFLTNILVVMVSVGVMMFALQTQFRFALSTTDLYLYHVASAIIEELFFRMFLINFLKKYSKSTILSVLFSSFLFSIAHLLSGYGIELLLAMFLGGLIFSAAYLAWKDITIPMLAHLIINVIVVGFLVQSIQAAGGV